MRAFTLIELLLAIGLIAAIAGLSAPVLYSFQVQNDVNVTVNASVQMLRKAQESSRGGDGDSRWGVHVSGNDLVLFQGSDYAGRDVAFDEVYSFPYSISLSGDSEIVFEKASGLPVAGGTVTFSSSTGESRDLVVNSMGMIEF